MQYSCQEMQKFVSAVEKNPCWQLAYLDRLSSSSLRVIHWFQFRKIGISATIIRPRCNFNTLCRVCLPFNVGHACGLLISRRLNLVTLLNVPLLIVISKLLSYGRFSRRVVWMKVASSNNNPAFIAQYYVDYIREIQGILHLCLLCLT